MAAELADVGCEVAHCCGGVAVCWVVGLGGG